jgi:hypothetical protein
MKSGFALALPKSEKRVFNGVTNKVVNTRFQAKNADFMYNGFNGRHNPLLSQLFWADFARLPYQ